MATAIWQSAVQTACQCMKMGRYCMSEIVVGLMDFYYQCWHMHSASLACCLAHTLGLFRAASSVCRAAAASSSVNRRALCHTRNKALQCGWAGLWQKNMLTTFHKSQHLSIWQSLVWEASKCHDLIQKYAIAPDIWRCTKYAIWQALWCHPTYWKHSCGDIKVTHISCLTVYQRNYCQMFPYTERNN